MKTNSDQLTLPVFHLNGTSHQSLTKQYQIAYIKLQEFLDAFSEIEFHARDYYPLGDDAFNKADSERSKTRMSINEVYKYLTAHIEHCYDHAK